jgi:CheY-like chemotaxis protein
MDKKEILPYFHPTQVVLVDNDVNFLGNLSLQLDADLAYLLFDSTEKALHYINDRENRVPSASRFFRPIAQAGQPVERGPSAAMQLDFDAIAQEMFFSNRFSRISVAMVDYAMPQMNGLELCRRIRDPSIKKILFTGVATETDAIEAFNNGVIDHYIRKSEHRVYETVNRRIRELQIEHIREFFDNASGMFRVTTPAFLADRGVIELVEELRQEFAYVEHYLVEDPDGLLLIAANARIKRLVLADVNCSIRQSEWMAAAGAPESLSEQVLAGDLILDPSAVSNQERSGGVQSQWLSHLRPGNRLPGSSAYRWALFDVQEIPNVSGRAVSSFNQYLDWIDRQGFSMM